MGPRVRQPVLRRGVRAGVAEALPVSGVHGGVSDATPAVLARVLGVAAHDREVPEGQGQRPAMGSEDLTPASTVLVAWLAEAASADRTAGSIAEGGAGAQERMLATGLIAATHSITHRERRLVRDGPYRIFAVTAPG